MKIVLHGCKVKIVRHGCKVKIVRQGCKVKIMRHGCKLKKNNKAKSEGQRYLKVLTI